MAKNQLPFAPGSLLFAPLEGVTDGPYRQMLFEHFDDWNYYFTDFLRLPTQGTTNASKIIEHYGKKILNTPQYQKRTGLQVLTSPRAQTANSVELINRLGIEHLDLNLGCPSKKVNSHLGGAYLLSDLAALENVIKTVRSHFTGTFTVKIRTGYRDTSLFEDIIHLLCHQGVDAITIHGRTRDQLYKGQAQWELIKKAVSISSVPIIGNGDVWSCDDIENLFEQTGCHSVMCGRGAMKTPWLAQLYREDLHLRDSEAYQLELRKSFIREYYEGLEKKYAEKNPTGDRNFMLSRFKGLSRYLFDDFEQGHQLRSNLLRSQSLDHFYSHLNRLDQIH